MSEDLTKKLPKSDSEVLLLILTTTQKLEARFDKLEPRVEQIDSRLQNLEQKVDLRLHDTRPIWHKVVANIGELQTGQKGLEEGLSKLHRSILDVNRDQIVINDSLRRIQLDLRTFDERLYGCEMNRGKNSST